MSLTSQIFNEKKKSNNINNIRTYKFKGPLISKNL